MDIFTYVGIFCFVWMFTGLSFFVTMSIADWIKGARNDGELFLGLCICIGAGPLMFWVMFASWLDERRYRRRTIR